MEKLLRFAGMTAGGWLGWAMGHPAGLLAAFALSMVGTGAGLYAAHRALESWF